jgi:Holliday junction resolvase RusA-like endonuclease
MRKPFFTDIPDLHGEMWIPFAPTAKGRPRLSRLGGVHTPKKTRDAEQLIRDFVFYHHSIPEPLEYPLAVSIRFFFKGLKVNYHTSRPDADNLGKLVLDSLGPKIYTYLGVKTLGKGILYNDDSQIVSLMIDKYYHPIQGIWVRWRTMPYPFSVKHPLDKVPAKTQMSEPTIQH